MAADSTQKPPQGLSAAGKDLWQRIAGVYVLDEREAVLLAAASHQADVVAALEAEAGGDVMATGSRGQLVLHPAILEARQGRLVMANLLGKLALPSSDDKPMTDQQRHAQRAALARWDRPGRRTRAG